MWQFTPKGAYGVYMVMNVQTYWPYILMEQLQHSCRKWHTNSGTVCLDGVDSRSSLLEDSSH